MRRRSAFRLRGGATGRIGGLESTRTTESAPACRSPQHRDDRHDSKVALETHVSHAFECDIFPIFHIGRAQTCRTSLREGNSHGQPARRDAAPAWTLSGQGAASGVVPQREAPTRRVGIPRDTAVSGSGEAWRASHTSPARVRRTSKRPPWAPESAMR